MMMRRGASNNEEETMTHQLWVHFEDFVQSLSAPEGDSSKPKVKRGIRPSEYIVPLYPTDEKDIIEKIVLIRLCRAGLLQGRIENGKLCFRLTPRGRKTIIL
jgi:hypothetical protein